MNDQLEQARLMRCRHDWPVYHLKHLARLTGGGTPAKENGAFWEGGDVPWISPKDMKRRVITSAEDYITEDAVDGSATSFVDAGFPLMVVRSGILRHTLPVAIAGRRLTLNQDMKAFNLSSRLNPMFFVYWVEGQSSDLLLEWRQFGATVESIDTGRLLNGRVALPDLPTQKAIADFLDRETVRIDQLIEKKQRIVEVLGERLCAEREALVWIHSKFAKLGHHISILSGYAFPSDGFSYDPLDVRLLRGANIGVDTLRWDDVVYWPADDYEQLKRFRLEIGDLVMGMDRPWISGGMRVATVGPDDVPSFLLQRVCKINPRATMNGMFLKELLHSRRFLAHFEPILTGVSVPHISPDQIAGFRFPYIDPDAQASQMEHFAKLAHWMRRAIYTTKTTIDRLREFRSALITAAVTGRIDASTWGKQGTTVRRLDQIEEATSA